MAILYIIKFGDEDYLASRNINNVNIEALFNIRDIEKIEMSRLDMEEILEDAETNNIIIDDKLLGYLDKQHPELMLSIVKQEENQEKENDIEQEVETEDQENGKQV